LPLCRNHELNPLILYVHRLPWHLSGTSALAYARAEV